MHGSAGASACGRGPLCNEAGTTHLPSVQLVAQARFYVTVLLAGHDTNFTGALDCLLPRCNQNMKLKVLR